MANILLITDYYPPRKSIASNRMKAFEKYLSEAGHKVFVITLGDKSACVVENSTTVYYCTGDGWLKAFDTNMKESAIRHYLKCAFNIIFTSVYVYSDAWVRNIIKTYRDIIQEQQIDVMITSYPSIATMVAGREIKSLSPDIKWTMDMRDAVWTPGNNDFIRNKLINITKECLKVCDGVTAVSKPQLDQYVEYTDRDILFEIVHNGYDFDVPNFQKSNSDSFNILYTGNFYGARSPKNFMEAFEKCIKKHNLNDLCFEIIGNNSIVSFSDSIKDVVKETDRMDYKALVEYCGNHGDLLLVVIPKSQEKGVYTGKLFDYIGIGKPILGLVPEDDVAAALIKQAGNGYVAENENIEEIEEAIYAAYMDWKNNHIPSIDKNIQRAYHRREQVAKLDNLISVLLEKDRM